jgi:hypothetical protein
MSVTSIIHSPTERDFELFRYNITSYRPGYGNRFSQNPIILYTNQKTKLSQALPNRSDLSAHPPLANAFSDGEGVFLQ